MPYTRVSMAIVWSIVAVLVGMTASGAVTGLGVLLVVLAALMAPALLRETVPARVSVREPQGSTGRKALHETTAGK